MKASTRLARIPRNNPAAEPKASNLNARPNAACNTSLCCAPRAIRIPNSRFRSPSFSDLHHPDAMVLAIADVKRAALNEDAVRPGQLACKRIAVGAIAALAGADHGRDFSIPQIDSANNVTFCVGYVESTLRRVCNALGPIQFCRHCRATVARISHFAGSCQQ